MRSIFLLLTIFFVSAAQTYAQHVPAIKRGQLQFSTSSNKPENSGILIIKDRRGRPIYELGVRATSMDSKTTDTVRLYLFPIDEDSASTTEEENNLLDKERSLLTASEVCHAAVTNGFPRFRREFNSQRVRLMAVLDKISCSPGFEQQRGGLSSFRITVTAEPGAPSGLAVLDR